MPKEHIYDGPELEFFSHATNWKKYYTDLIKYHLKGHVLEIGAGFGSSTLIMHNDTVASWTCLEPDLRLFKTLNQNIKTLRNCQPLNTTTKSLNTKSQYNTIIYIDVIEHIANHQAELKRAYKLLSSNGNLIILAPAHNWLYSAFDKNIGHIRRYTKNDLLETIPPELTCLSLQYLDTMGIVASYANKLILKQKIPNLSQILFWDKYLIPISQKIDRATNFKIGKSILGIWQKK